MKTKEININNKEILNENLITYHNPKSQAAEAYRSFRTNIGFANIDKKIKSIVVTGPGKNVGKSSTAANMAISMAQIEKKVLLLECDLRNPTVHKFFGVSNDIGLTHILTDMIIEEQHVSKMAKKISEIENLSIIPSGFIPPNPSEILSSQKMKQFLSKLREEYDVVILDTPPVGQLTDAAILGKISDGVIMVIASGQTNVDMAKRAKQALLNVDAKILGAVLTKLDRTAGGYYYYRYYSYDYYYANDEADK